MSVQVNRTCHNCNVISSDRLRMDFDYLIVRMYTCSVTLLSLIFIFYFLQIFHRSRSRKTFAGFSRSRHQRNARGRKQGQGCWQVSCMWQSKGLLYFFISDPNCIGYQDLIHLSVYKYILPKHNNQVSCDLLAYLIANIGMLLCKRNFDTINLKLQVYQWKLLNHVARDHNLTLKPAHLSYKCTVCTATFGMYKQFLNHVYSAHSVVAKRVMDKSKSSAPKTNSESLLKPLKINDEITIIPQPVKSAPGQADDAD